MQWVKNCIGYLYKERNAPFIDPQYFPSKQGGIDNAMIQKQSANIDTYMSQYAQFPQSLPTGFNMPYAASLINNNPPNLVSLTGQPIQYLPQPAYNLAGQ